jgi:hypothetical protein
MPEIGIRLPIAGWEMPCGVDRYEYSRTQFRVAAGMPCFVRVVMTYGLEFDPKGLTLSHFAQRTRRTCEKFLRVLSEAIEIRRYPCSRNREAANVGQRESLSESVPTQSVNRSRMR